MRWWIAIGALAALATTQLQVSADLEQQLYTSRSDRLRFVVPRGWRATDQPSYPGLLLWMVRVDPPNQTSNMVLTAQAFTREVYCSWPVTCRTNRDATLAEKLACALGQKLQARRIHVGQIQAGPKENEAAGLPSVWLEYDDGKQFFRHALAVSEDRVVSLVLTASSNEARAQHARAFEQALRTMRPLTAEELGSAATPAQSTPAPPNDAGIEGNALLDAAVGANARSGTASASASFESAPAPKINPVGSCAQK